MNSGDSAGFIGLPIAALLWFSAMNPSPAICFAWFFLRQKQTTVTMMTTATTEPTMMTGMIQDGREHSSLASFTSETDLGSVGVPDLHCLHVTVFESSLRVTIWQLPHVGLFSSLQMVSF